MKFEIDKEDFWITKNNATFLVPDLHHRCSISKGLVETEIMIHIGEASERVSDTVLAEFCNYIGISHEQVTRKFINHVYWDLYTIPTVKIMNNLFFKKLELLAERKRFDLLVRQTNKISIEDLKKILELRLANGH